MSDEKFCLLPDLTVDFRIQARRLSCLTLHIGSDLFYW